jgi:hypothetical protein
MLLMQTLRQLGPHCCPCHCLQGLTAAVKGAAAWMQQRDTVGEQLCSWQTLCCWLGYVANSESIAAATAGAVCLVTLICQTKLPDTDLLAGTWQPVVNGLSLAAVVVHTTSPHNHGSHNSSCCFMSQCLCLCCCLYCR